jgi:hypothetical protein
VVVGWFSPGTPVSSTNKTDRHDITEILLKVALNTKTPNINISNKPGQSRITDYWADDTMIPSSTKCPLAGVLI